MEYTEFQKQLKKASPRTTLSWELYQKRRRKKRIVLGILVAVFALIWFLLYNARADHEQALTRAIVTADEITKGTQIEKKHLTEGRFAYQQLPSGYFDSVDNLIGLFAVQNMPANAIITDEDVKIFIQNDSMAVELGENEVAFTIDASWLEGKFPKITKGDRINILVSNPQRSIEDTIFLINSAEVIDYVQDGRSTSANYVTVKVTEEESRNILYAKAKEQLLIIVLTQ